MNLTPRQLQDQLNTISDESYRLHMELATLESELDTTWLGLRSSCETDGECTRKLGATEKGKRRAYLKIYLKGLSHKRTALIQESKANSGNSW